MPKQKSVTEQVNRSFQRINQVLATTLFSKQLYSSAPIQQFTYIQYPSLQSAIAVTKVDVSKNLRKNQNWIIKILYFHLKSHIAALSGEIKLEYVPFYLYKVRIIATQINN